MGQGEIALPHICRGQGTHIHEAGAEPVVKIRPKCRPPRSNEAFFATFYRGGLIHETTIAAVTRKRENTPSMTNRMS